MADETRQPRGMSLALLWQQKEAFLGRFPMLWTLIVLLLLFWVVGFALNVAAGMIHILLVIAAVLFIVNLVRGRSAI